MSIGPKPLRSVDYPAERLGEAPWRIYAMCRKGLIPHVKLGRRYKFDPEALERWIESGGSGL
jgi:excisionase family DNA binding protein